MATYSWNTKIRHDSDAEFRLWGAEIGVALAAVGCVQTADTGQINWTTVTRAAINADAGYEIWYINDSLHATAPIYFKLYYGTGPSATTTRLRLEVGTGSNGSGTITGGNSVTTIATNSTMASVDTTYTSYCALANGCLSLFGKIGKNAVNFAVYGFVIARTCDSTGAADATGAVVLHHNASSSTSAVCPWRVVRFASPAAGWMTVIAGAAPIINASFTEATSVDENGDNQLFLAMLACKRIRPWSNFGGYVAAEITMFTTFAGVALIGSTTYTWLPVSTALGYCVGHGAGANGAYGLFVPYQ